ncbi:SRPBCC family protein [Streptomyces sp. NPDC020801]|uniref:SRPBCC family protein n=1 Tax=unclassified Streptomyces TaxID=2593676 RepID=UPI00379EE91E
MTTKTAHAALEIDAPVEQVWGLVRDFGRIAAWHPLVRSSVTDQDGPAQPGVIRTMTMTDGVVINERLIELSDPGTVLAYEWTGTPPVAVAEAEVRIRVESIPDGRSRVSMEGRFAGGEPGAAELAVSVSESTVWPAALRGLAETLTSVQPWS